MGKQLTFVVALDEAEMAVVVMQALIEAKAPAGLSAQEACAEVEQHNPVLLEDARRVVRALMTYWRDKVNAGAGARSAAAAGLGGGGLQ